MQTQEYAVAYQHEENDEEFGMIADERLASPATILMLSDGKTPIASGGATFNVQKPQSTGAEFRSFSNEKAAAMYSQSTIDNRQL